MTKDELIVFIEELCQNPADSGIALKFIYHLDGEYYSYVPALEEKHLKPQMLKDYLASVRRTFLDKNEDSDFEFVQVNKGEATDIHTIYHIKQSQIPEAGKIFNAPDLEQSSGYEFKKQELSSIWGVVITLGNATKNITLFKKNYSINVLKKTSSYQVFFNKGALSLFDDDLLKLTTKFDVALVNGELLIVNKKEFETHFKYIAAMESEANKRIDTIINSKIVDDATKIYDLIKKKRTLKKILNIDPNNPIFKTAPKKIATFAKKYKLEIELTEDQTKISITSQKSAEIFIKLLNDDYLHSELTKLLYDSRGKTKLN